MIRKHNVSSSLQKLIQLIVLIPHLQSPPQNCKFSYSGLFIETFIIIVSRTGVSCRFYLSYVSRPAQIISYTAGTAYELLLMSLTLYKISRHGEISESCLLNSELREHWLSFSVIGRIKTCATDNQRQWVQIYNRGRLLSDPSSAS